MSLRGGISRIRGVFQWPKQLKFIRGYMVVVGSVIVHMTLGSIYTFGNLVPYLISYIRQRSHPTDLHPTTGAWIYALALAGQGLSMFFGGLLERKIGPRLSTLIGCGIMTLGVLLSYVAIKVSFWFLLVTYGLMFGLGLGIAYVAPLASSMRWMPRWKGLTAGCVLAGFGIGALIFDPIQTAFINPRNLPGDENGNGLFYDDDLLDRVPVIFLILGGIYAVLQIVGALLIVDPPEEDETEEVEEREQSNVEEHVMSRADNFFRKMGSSYSKPIDQSKRSTTQRDSQSPEPPSRNSSEPSSPGHMSQDFDDSISSPDEGSRLIPRELNLQQASPERRAHRSAGRSPLREDMKTFSRTSDLESSTTSTSSRNVVANLDPLKVLRKLNFYLLWIMMLLAGFAVFFSASLYKFFGLGFIRDDHFLAIVGSVSSICNCAGRIVWGLIADRVSYKFALVLQSGIMTVFLLTFYATSVVGKPMFFIWVCVIFFCIGGVFSLFPTAIARSFGSKYMSINYGLLFTSQITSSVMAALLFSTLQHLLDWVGIIFLVSGVSLVGFVFTLFFQSKRYVVLDLGGK